MSSYVSGRLLPWKRFWVPWDGAKKCSDDGRGFLSDPEDRWGKVWNPQVRAIGELLEKRCIVLSGHPGMGKTAAIDQAIAELRTRLTLPHILVALRCRDIPSAEILKQLTVDSVAWRRARESSGDVTLIIDGVDEGLRKAPEFVRTLRVLLAGEPTDKLRVVLVCRSAEWDFVGGQELLKLWPEEQRAGVMALCPLQQRDAVEAAEAMNLNADAFIEAVYRKRVQGMAARPITLKMLLKEFERGHSFPESNRALYLRAARDLCAELDEDRERLLTKYYKRPPEPQIFVTVCRIAALVMVCGKSTVLRSRETPAEHELPVGAIVGGRESCEGSLFEVTEGVVAAALETPHFSFRGQNRFGFDHQTFAEALAAEYLRDFDLPQIRRLLCQPLGDREFVTPQLAEVASWLACSRQDWAEFLIRADPEVLLRTDVSELTDMQRESTVSALLARASQLEVFDDPSLAHYYRTLRHKRLAGQLRPYINNASQSHNVRDIAIDIAGHAGVREVEPDLWRLLRSGAQPRLFNTTVHALGRLAGKHSRPNVMRALRGKFAGDTQQTLLGEALQVAVPKLLPVRKVLPFLRPRAIENYFGSYRAALAYHLPRYITKADLPVLLKHLNQWPQCFDSLSPFHELAEQAFDLALEHLNDSQIRRALVTLWTTRAQKFEPLPDTKRKPKPGGFVGLSDRSRRLAFARSLLNDPATKSIDLLIHDGPLLSVKDLGWLLRELPRSPRRRRNEWMSVTASFVWSATRNEVSAADTTRLSEHSKEFLTVYEACPEFRAIFPKPGRFDVLTALERSVKAQDLRFKRRREAIEKSRELKRPLPRRKQFTIVFDNMRRTKNASWWVAIVQLACWNPGPGDTETRDDVRFDITATTGWKSLTPSEQRTARRTAHDFLLGFVESGREPNQSTDFSEAGYYAVGLHRRSILKDPLLRAAVVKKWVPAVVDFFNNGEPEHRQIIAFIYRVAPRAATGRLLEHLRKDAKAEGFALFLRAFSDCWDRRLSSAVLRFAERKGGNPHLLRNVLVFLAEHDTEATMRAIARRLNTAQGGGLKAWRTQAYVFVALLKFPRVLWNDAWRLVAAASKSVCGHFFLKNSDQTDERSDILGHLSERQVAALYLRLAQLFPPEKDPQFNKAHWVGAPEHMQRFRDAALSRIVVIGSEDALHELRRIITAQPARRREHLAWYYQKALRNHLQRLWVARVPPPSEVLTLRRIRDARLIETEDDLVAAILDSLVRLQTQLKQGGLVSVHDLWNTPARHPSSPKAEKFVSRKIANWLKHDLGTSVIINREVQVESLGGGKLDIKVEARNRSAVDPRPLVVIIEVKRCSHDDIAHACRTQLVQGYLERNAWTHGLYLVGWFGVGSVPSARWNTIEKARLAIEGWAAAAAKPPLRVAGFVLDCRLSAAKAPSALRRS